MSALIVFLVSGAVFASEPAAIGSQTLPLKKTIPVRVKPRVTASSMAVAPKPLTEVLTRKMFAIKPQSVCVTVPNALEGVLQKDLAASNACKAAGMSYERMNGGLLTTVFLPSIKKYCCSDNASFSIQEQQAAGCTGSDTVDVCMEKLSRACIHRIGAIYKNALQKKQKEISTVSTSAGQLDQKLQQLLNTIP